MTTATALSILGSAERCSKLALSAHELLTERGETAIARIVWVFHLEASRSAEAMGAELGIEADAA